MIMGVPVRPAGGRVEGWQAEKRPIAALLQKGQILTYWKSASALTFFCALHSNIFEQPAKMYLSTICQ
ncbi:MAG: hypothetical protein V3571_13185 [Pseudodesulfovibrio sp.]